MLELINIVENFSKPRVLLVGDFMLDRYVYGNVERISPEAPVPVLRTVRNETRIGGAGNAADAIVALGGRAVCLGLIGTDDAGTQLIAKLNDAGADTTMLLRRKTHPTTIKTRYVGLAQHRHAQQMFRVDEEAVDDASDRSLATMLAAVRRELKGCGVLAIEDYNKGVLTDSACPQLIAEARKVGTPVVVDPACISNYRRYRGATLLTPNRYEASIASGIAITDDESLARAAKQVLLIAEADAVVVTLDREGCYLLRRNSPPVRIAHSHPRAVYDITGAGDEVLGMLAMALAEDCDLEHAVALANVVGGLEVERFGVVAITRDEVLDELRGMVGLRGKKVVARKRLREEVSRRRERGETIVFTNGCFDLLHMGHVRYLRQARELGNCLVVAINSDASVTRLKGPERPIVGQDERAEMLGALECVDYVTIFGEDTPKQLLKQLQPDVLAKGGTTTEVVGRDIVEDYGGKVLTLDKVDGLSTTEIIDQIIGTGKKKKKK